MTPGINRARNYTSSVAGRRTAARHMQARVRTTRTCRAPSLASGCDDDHFLRVVLQVFSAPPAVDSH
jgi:hypothetical protein